MLAPELAEILFQQLLDVFGLVVQEVLVLLLLNPILVIRVKRQVHPESARLTKPLSIGVLSAFLLLFESF